MPLAPIRTLPPWLPVFESFGCTPRRLELIIAKALGCSAVHIQSVLGQGCCNVVLDVLLPNCGQASKLDGNVKRVAIRIPLSREPPRITAQQAIAGYSATLFLSNLGLPVAVAGPVYPADVPYAPPGRGQITVMPVLEGCRMAWRWWNYATPAAKGAVVADLAAVVLRLYRHPLQGFGDMALTPGGVPCVGPVHGGAVAVAARRGTDVGELSPGPYSRWKEFAWNQIRGLELLYGDHRLYGEQIKADCKRVLEWLDKFKPLDEKLYLVHPDFKSLHVMVEPDSGHVRSLIDWDFARAGTVQFLAANFFLPFVVLSDEILAEIDEEQRTSYLAEEEELRVLYVEELRRGGAPELVQYVFRGWERKDPQFMFEEALCPIFNLRKNTPRRACSGLRSFCTRMGFSGESEGMLQLHPPWKRRHRPKLVASAGPDQAQLPEAKIEGDIPSSSSEEEPFTSSSGSSSSFSSSSSTSVEDEPEEVTSAAS